MSDGISLPKPPGHTCPQIDKAQSSLRRLAWRAHRSNAEAAAKLTEGEMVAEVSLRQDDVSLLLREGVRALEEVRAENAAMRAAHAAAVKGAAVIEEAVRLVRSGYDGPFTGDVSSPLRVAIREYEQALTATKRSR
jgi:hypothetical protein